MATLSYRDPNTQQFVQASIGSGMPVGSITAFAGTTAPDGWHLCDGTPHGSDTLRALLLANGSGTPDFTPNLQDRFVVSVGPGYVAGATGGAATVTVTAAQSGNSGHTHGVTSGANNANHTHTFTSSSSGSHSHAGGVRAITIRNTDLSQSTGGEHALIHTSTSQQLWPAVAHTHTTATSANPSANHTHTLTVAASAAVAATAAHENMPPFYALAFIICTG